MSDTTRAKEQAAAQLSSIRGMLAALHCDYDRLEELRTERNSLTEEELRDWPYSGELSELEDSAGECVNQEDAQQTIYDDPLSVQIRSGWYAPGQEGQAEEFEILLCAGGPAVRIMGELDEHNQPSRAYMQYQDWGTPWIDYYEEGCGAACLEYAKQFYFGE